MKKILVISCLTLSLQACGDKSVSVQDIQNGVQHATNIINSKNASEAIANVAHAASDVAAKVNSSQAK